jgi:hypothetical protein
MKKLLILLILLVFTVPGYTATIYKWVDKEGVVHFTDDISKVPPAYRNQIKTEERKDADAKVEREPPPLPPPRTRQSGPQKIKQDIYGRDETWWREKVGVWKEKLKAATENLENLTKKYAEDTEQLGRTGLVSRSRYQDKANKYTEEKKKYEAQIAEANEMLEKLSEEARETKADPAWLE